MRSSPGVRNADSRLPLVELREATLFAHGRRIFPRTCWAIHSGEHWAIVGPNGSGKSTLAKALSDEVLVLDGEVLHPHAGGRLQEADIRHVSFQDQTNLIVRYSRYLQGRYESLEGDDAPAAADLLGLPAAGGSPESLDLLDRLGLRPIVDRRVTHLSNGETRKLLIARALLERPRLLVLEEPLQGLDQDSRRGLSRLLRAAAGLGVTIVLVTARPGDVIPPVDRVLCVRDGTIVGQGRRRDLAPGGRLSHGSAADSLTRPDPALPAPSVRRTGADALVEMRDVTVSYEGVKILDRVNWTVREGESWALVGPNGSGKTTLLSLILADNPQAYANEVRVFGHLRGDGLSIWEIKDRLGHVSPEAQMHEDPEATVLEGICSGFADGATLRHVCSQRQLRKARAWARALDLGDLLGSPYRFLSDGQKRLALMARALAKSPRLLVLDEPCQGLDDAHAAKVLRVVEALVGQGALTVILVTHEPKEIPACIGRVLHLDHGRVTGIGKRQRERTVN